MGTFNKDQTQTFKCKNDPIVSTSSAYDVAVPYFESETSEEWIYFQRYLRRAFIGQGDNNGPQQYSKVCMLLQDEALAAFENPVFSVGNIHTETKAFLQEAVNTITESVFFKRTTQVQKRYLRHFLQKPYEI